MPINWEELLSQDEPEISVTNKFGIDVQTEDANKLIRRLKALRSTFFVENGGMYHQDKSYSQVHVLTTMTESELEDWLYRTKGVDYVGVFKTSKGENENVHSNQL